MCGVGSVLCDYSRVFLSRLYFLRPCFLGAESVACDSVGNHNLRVVQLLPFGSCGKLATAHEALRLRDRYLAGGRYVKSFVFFVWLV